MRIEELNVALRARNPWESFDLGFALARHTGANLYLAFGVPYLLFVLLVNLVTWGSPTLALLIVWWCKPVFDRIALHVMSQAVFGETPSWRRTINGLLKIPRTGLLYSLTLGRLDFARSLHLAVFQLEGQTGKARRQRIALLDRTVRGSAVWLTVVIIHFVYVLLFGLDGFLKMISPEGAQFSLRLGDYFSLGASEPSLTSQYLFNAALALAEWVLEPIYVGSGFSLYLSRRTVLEGWDLEVAFKRMSARIEATGAANASFERKVAVLTLSVMLLHGLAGSDAWAQAGAVETPSMAVPDDVFVQLKPVAEKSAEKRMIADILKSPDFKEYEKTKVWRPKNPVQEAPRNTAPMSEGWLAFARFIAQFMHIALWVVAMFFVGWLLYYLSRRMGWFRDWVASRDTYKPDVLFGLDLRAESLPEDIPAAARALLTKGDVRAALSLLYRGALRVLIHERDLTVKAGDTEGDCVRRVNRDAPGVVAEYFRTLVDAWGLVAYARRMPEPALTRGLVEDWARHFVPRPGPKGEGAPT